MAPKHKNSDAGNYDLPKKVISISEKVKDFKLQQKKQYI
jgi:hypothetical protein